jgi:hypothetical protein
MKKNVQLLLILLGMLSFSAEILAQEKFSISGQIKAAESGEAQIGASIYVKEIANGTASNVYGFYSLTLPKGQYTLVASYIGFETITKTLELSANTKLDFELLETSKALSEVTVKAEKVEDNVKSIEMSVNKLNIKTIQKMPAFMGEVDVIKSIQMLPGVTSVGEGAAGFNVRGGSIDQNLVLLDEAPVYNSSHLFGFFSVFNPDAVKNVQLVKGGISAQYGGRLASILDVRMKEGNEKKLEVNGGVGLIFSRLSIEAPIIKDKASFIIAARRSYFDFLAKPFLKEDLKENKLNFYDLTAKVNYKINDNNRVFLSGYFGKDNFGGPTTQIGFNWGNATSTLRWNHVFNQKLFFNFTTFYSKYDYLVINGKSKTDGFEWSADIVNSSVKPEFTFYANPKNTIKFGAQTLYYDFDPGKAKVVTLGNTNNVALPHKYALESALYFENEQQIGNNLSLQYGLRYSNFNYLGKGYSYEYKTDVIGESKILVSTKAFNSGENIKKYGNFEPRFSAKINLRENSSIKASYNHTAQYIHLLSNTTASLPVDIWTPSTNNIKPQIADQVALGYFKNLGSDDKTIEASIEIYYKKLQNQVDNIDGSSLLLNEHFEADLLSGRGRAYGVEFQLKKSKGPLTGWLSYTLARSERQTDGINHSKWYDNRYDKRHNLNITTAYQLKPRVQVAANFAYNSGSPSTFPTNRIELQGWIVPQNVDGSRNNYRIPAYHRLDLSLTLKTKQKLGSKVESNWVFSLYNAYNRQNPLTVFFQTNKDNPQKTEAINYSLIGSVLPGVTYNFKF